MNPASIDAMSWEMAEVYGAITDQIVINLAHYFPYLSAGKHPPKSMFDYQAAMLAQMGKINAQTMQIIRNNLSDADRALSASLETAIADAIKDSEPALYRGAKAGIFKPPTKPVLSANQTRAFGLYYKQAADKLNLVNTVMLESTQSAYMQTVSNVISEYEILERLNRTQIALDVAAGETITGVSSWNTAVRHATQRMKDGGITGFIDHAGRHWDAETYVAMDIRTTMFNTGRAAVWETNEGFGNDLYIVSYHNGARPLCYDWQNKVISANNVSRDVADLDGNVVHVYAQNETTYGEPAGLFGINCKHYPTPFVPGVSVVRGQVQDKAENDKQYAESQKQRALERNLREQKRDLEMLKAQGADEDIIRAQREKVRAASKDIDDFCDETGRVRRRNREAVYTKRDFPSGNYDPAQFAREQQKRFDDYWKNGGTQSGFTFGQLVPNVPIPINPQTPPVAPAQNVASQATQTPFNYGKPFDDQGYKTAQRAQIADAKQALDNAPQPARNAWERVADRLKTPDFDSRNSDAYYRSADWRVHFKTYKKAFEQSSYQRKNACWYHEYGHNIDELLGSGGWGNRISATYKNKAGKTFGEMLSDECDDALKSFYLHKHNVKDAYEAVKASNDANGGTTFKSLVMRMLRGNIPGNEFDAIRDALIDAADDDDSILRPIVDKWLTPNFETAFKTLYHGFENGADFCEWVNKTYTIYQRTDISDMFENYMVKTFGKTFEYPFTIGHGKNYWNDVHQTSGEAFAEMYSAYVAAPDSLETIKEFFPQAFQMFVDMLEGAV